MFIMVNPRDVTCTLAQKGGSSNFNDLERKKSTKQKMNNHLQLKKKLNTSIPLYVLNNLAKK